MRDPSFIYLDNAATSWPKPAVVGEEMARFLAESAGNPGRGGHALAREAAGYIERARAALARLIGAEKPERVVLTPGCTDSVNLAVHGWLWKCLHEARRGGGQPHVVMSSVEHNAVGRSLHAHEEDGEIELTIVPCDERGFVSAAAMLGACHERTVLACLSHASNACGTIQPVREVGAGLRARSPSALFMVDAAQTAGHLAIDVRGMNIDLLTIAGHKGLLGPTGTGALYVGPRAFSDEPDGPRLHCTRSGGTGAKSPGLEMPAELPDALEAGTSNAVGFAGLLAAMEHKPAGAHENETARTEELLGGLRAIQGVKIYGVDSAHDRTAVVMFNIEGMPPREVGAVLDGEFTIAVRAGLHCAPMLHKSLRTFPDGAVRASPGWSTTREQVERFVRAVGEIAASR